MLAYLRKKLPDNAPIRIAYSRAKGIISSIIARNYSKKMTVIGITGTDGKTTTAHFTAQLLEQLGEKV